MSRNAKCKKCRKPLFREPLDDELLIDAHSVPTGIPGRERDDCPSIQDEKLIFLHEDHVPGWISGRLKSENWQKGKIICPHCEGRIGSFDFTSGMKCECGTRVLPAVHLIKSKIDLI